ncbi:apotyrosinase chaperone MelC1 [Streptomyces sp. NBC_00443]|uniref:apotyrosinase chaperone MelC1 n=1 Tax=Streptomyces sp. NBC_00443 TaxID=2975743 RepID=UPI002E1D241A
MPELSRRRALTAAAALATVAGVQTVTAPTANTASAIPAASTASTAAHDHHAPAPSPFDEVYKGRRIQGRPASGGGHEHHGAGYAVLVDGVELHVMRNADGSWISIVSHYDPVSTPRAAARAAVDELQGAALLPFPTG